MDTIKTHLTPLSNLPHVLRFLHAQLFPLPTPTASFTGQTIIVTGANTGLGLEAARHFARLGAARVILACRSVENGEAARRDILQSLAANNNNNNPHPPTTQNGTTPTSPSPTTPQIETWPLDLTSPDSIRHFTNRALTTLPRLDILVCNAAVALPHFSTTDDLGGYETTIGVNVIGTFFLTCLLFPHLRATALRFNTTPRLVIVASDAHFLARFAEGKGAQEGQPILPYYKTPIGMSDRYNTSKLLEILFVRELVHRLSSPSSTTPTIIINTLNPGFCRSDLFRHFPFPLSLIVRGMLLLLGRTTEQGARTLVAAAAAGPESHGQYMDSCVVVQPSAFVRSEEGRRVQKKVFDEIMAVLEGMEEGITKSVLSG